MTSIVIYSVVLSLSISLFINLSHCFSIYFSLGVRRTTMRNNVFFSSHNSAYLHECLVWRPIKTEYQHETHNAHEAGRDFIYLCFLWSTTKTFTTNSTQITYTHATTDKYVQHVLTGKIDFLTKSSWRYFWLKINEIMFSRYLIFILWR